MTAFIVRKKIDLSYLGEGWEKAYITFTPFTFGDNASILKLRKMSLNAVNADDKELQKATDEIMDLLKSKLVEGQGYDGKTLVPITKENLSELPMELVTKILEELQGNAVIPPKA